MAEQIAFDDIKSCDDGVLATADLHTALSIESFRATHMAIFTHIHHRLLVRINTKPGKIKKTFSHRLRLLSQHIRIALTVYSLQFCRSQQGSHVQIPGLCALL